MGWIGTNKQLQHTLNVVGADKDQEGRFLIYNSELVSFLGLGEEYVIDDDTSYSVNGKKLNLAHLMASTSYGLSITVIS